MTSQPWLVATDMQGAGGIASVLRVYAESGFLAQRNVRVLASHREGGGLAKLGVFLRGLAVFMGAALRRRACLLHVHSASHGSFWRKACFILVAGALRVPVLFHLHGGGFRKFYEEESGALARGVIRFVLRRVSVVAVLVEDWRGFAARLAPQAEVAVLPNPVVVPPDCDREPGRPPVVLFLGLVNERKGTFDLVRAMPAVLSRHSEVRFVIAGSGDLQALRETAKRLGVQESLETPGWIGGADKDALLRRATVFALPSYFEAMPMSLLEAMAHGLPCVASRVGGIPDVLADGREGMLLPPGDPAAWAKAINRLLDRPDAAIGLGKAARARVIRQFSAEAGLASLGHVYDRFCSRRAA